MSLAPRANGRSAATVVSTALFALPLTLGVAVLADVAPATAAAWLRGNAVTALGAVAVVLGAGLSSLYTLLRTAPWPRDVPLRWPARALAVLTFTASCTSAAILALLWLGGGDADPLVRTYSEGEFLLRWLERARAAASSPLHGVGGIPWLGVLGVAYLDFAVHMLLRVALLVLWFHVPLRIRLRVWRAVDATLLVATVAATFAFDITPADDSSQALGRAVLRFGLTVVLALRLFLRALPRLFDLVERVGFHTLVAARHLRTRGSRFVTIIGVLAVFAVAFSSCSLSTTLSLMGGFRNDLKQKILDNTAHVSVTSATAAEDDDPGLADWHALVDAVRRTDGVVGASPYVGGEVMVSSATNLAGAVVRGIDPKAVSSVSRLDKNIKRGRLEFLSSPEKLLDIASDDLLDPLPLKRGGKLSPDKLDTLTREPKAEPKPGDVLPGLIVGQELARSLRLYVGDEVNVVSPLGDLGPTGPIPKSRPFRIAGIFYSGMYEYDLKHVYMALDVAQRYFGTGDAIQGIDVRVTDVERAPAIRQALASKLGPAVHVADWQELNRNLFGALALEKLAMFVALGLGILVAGFCVFGTLTLMVQEKAREVGVLQAMGAARRDVLRIFLIDGLLIGLLGALGGLGMGFVVCYGAKHIGIGMNPEVYYIDRVPVHIDPV
ncbi:MAG: ABC transporter permease, partial [Myxococcales bacterium]|nr:ABC transporter permease [Myxococcales bacterium]